MGLPISLAWSRIPVSERQLGIWLEHRGRLLLEAASSHLVTGTLAEVRKSGSGIDDAAPNVPMDFARKRPAMCNLEEALGANSIEHALLLGQKLVNGIVVTQTGKTNLQLSLPTASAPGLLQAFCANDGEPMIRSLVTFIWGLVIAQATQT
jgi:hypothetical protein